MTELNRREVASREVGVFRKAAKVITSAGVTANQISVFSIFFALIGSAGLYLLPDATSSNSALTFAIIALLGIQGRLICNLLDGLVAIEGGKKTAVGEIFNEVPDRVSDTLLFCAAGFGLSRVGQVFGGELGLLASLLAVMTAYVRLLGGSLGLKQSFRGPMAKQHRMAVLNLGIIGTLFEIFISGFSGASILIALALITLGSVLTCLYRLRDIASLLKRR